MKNSWQDAMTFLRIAYVRMAPRRAIHTLWQLRVSLMSLCWRTSLNLMLFFSITLCLIKCCWKSFCCMSFSIFFQIAILLNVIKLNVIFYFTLLNVVLLNVILLIVIKLDFAKFYVAKCQLNVILPIIILLNVI